MHRMENDKFWLFEEHHGYKYMFEVDDEVMPYLLMFFEDKGQVEWCLEMCDDETVREAWETAKKTPTVANVAKFIREWEDGGFNDESVTFIHLEQFVTKESINDA